MLEIRYDYHIRYYYVRLKYANSVSVHGLTTFPSATNQTVSFRFLGRSDPKSLSPGLYSLLIHNRIVQGHGRDRGNETHRLKLFRNDLISRHGAASNKANWN